jgi:hypothetical protein
VIRYTLCNLRVSDFQQQGLQASEQECRLTADTPNQTE